MEKYGCDFMADIHGESHSVLWASASVCLKQCRQHLSCPGALWPGTLQILAAAAPCEGQAPGASLSSKSICRVLLGEFFSETLFATLQEMRSYPTSS